MRRHHPTTTHCMSCSIQEYCIQTSNNDKTIHAPTCHSSKKIPKKSITSRHFQPLFVALKSEIRHNTEMATKASLLWSAFQKAQSFGSGPTVFKSFHRKNWMSSLTRNLEQIMAPFNNFCDKALCCHPHPKVGKKTSSSTPIRQMLGDS